MPSDGDLSNMQAALDKLNAAQTQAGVASGGFFTTLGANLLGDSSSAAAQQTALAQTQIAIGNLAGPEWLEVVSGTRSVDDWLSYAASTYATIQSVDKDLDNWTLGGVVTNSASATASQVKTDATVGLAIATPFLLLGAGLYLLLVLGPALSAGRAAS